MAKVYKGSLSLEWYNKQKAILLQEETEKNTRDLPAARLNWVNRDDALFYLIDDADGKGLKPFWVDRNDIRVKEARPLVFQKCFRAVQKDQPGTIPGTQSFFELSETAQDDLAVENYLIKGDNLLALNSIKKLFDSKPLEDRVKCIFIDPPYNTGKAFAQYDDNLELSEWLTLMRDRLVILHQILAEDGFIWITLDDKGVFHCKLLMDEIFGRDGFVGNVVWQHSVQGKNDAKKFSIHHNYILCYRKNEESEIGKVDRTEEHNKNYSNPDNDPNGMWRSGDVRSPNYRANLIYDIPTPSGKNIPAPENGWRWKKEEVEKKIKSGEVIFNEDETRITRKIYLKNQEGRVPETIWFDSEIDSIPESFWYGKDAGTTREANNEIKSLFGQDVFDTPKPERLIKKIISLTTNEGDYVLDSFGGSGTTFAVAQKMNRRWVGVEIGKQCDEVIIERLKKVVSGQDKLGVTEDVGYKGGGGFKYYHLGPSIISQSEDQIGDLNWSLGKKFIQESLLASYDYSIDKSITTDPGQLFKTQENVPSVGVQKIGSKIRVAIVSLNEPSDKFNVMSYDEIQNIYQTVRKKFSPEFINIFTNRGVEMAYDSKPEDLEIIKIPYAIFAELEK